MIKENKSRLNTFRTAFVDTVWQSFEKAWKDLSIMENIDETESPKLSRFSPQTHKKNILPILEKDAEKLFFQGTPDIRGLSRPLCNVGHFRYFVGARTISSMGNTLDFQLLDTHGFMFRNKNSPIGFDILVFSEMEHSEFLRWCQQKYHPLETPSLGFLNRFEEAHTFEITSESFRQWLGEHIKPRVPLLPDLDVGQLVLWNDIVIEKQWSTITWRTPAGPLQTTLAATMGKASSFKDFLNLVESQPQDFLACFGITHSRVDFSDPKFMQKIVKRMLRGNEGNSILDRE